MCHNQMTHPLFLFSDNCNPYRFPLLPSLGDAADEAVEPDAGVHYHPPELVLAHQDAALRVVRIIACMDADALKTGHSLNERQKTLKPGRRGNKQRISALGYRRLAPNLARYLAAHPARTGIHFPRTQRDAQQIAPGRLQRIAEIMLLIQQRLREGIAKFTLVFQMPAETLAALYLILCQKIKMTYRIGLLLGYSLYYYFHKLILY